MAKGTGKKGYVTYWLNLSDATGKGKGTGTNVKFAWRAPSDSYPKEIATDLGINQATGTDQGLIYGMNNPRPARVRINVQISQGNNKSYVLFCAPSKLVRLLIQNPLKGKKFRGGTITTISLPGTSTHQGRSSSGSSKTSTNKRKPQKQRRKRQQRKKSINLKKR